MKSIMHKWRHEYENSGTEPFTFITFMAGRTVEVLIVEKRPSQSNPVLADKKVVLAKHLCFDSPW